MSVEKCEILRWDHQFASYKCLVKTEEDENKSTWNSAEGLQESLNSVYGPGTKFSFVTIGGHIKSGHIFEALQMNVKLRKGLMWVITIVFQQILSPK